MPRPSLRGPVGALGSLIALGFLGAVLPARAAVPSARPAALAAPLVKLLASPGRRHALADERGRVPFLVTLPPGGDAVSLGLLPVAPGFGAKRLDPKAFLAFADAHPELVLDVAPPRRSLLDVSKSWTRVEAFRKAELAAGAGTIDGTGVVVGIIDTGLDVRHADFRDKNGKTRVAWLLDAGAPEGLHADLEDLYGCTDPAQSACSIFAAADIDALLAKDSDRLGDLEGHGTHVTSIAAGNGGPSINKKPKYVGLAPNATLIVATPTKFFDPDILNAARFIFERAEALGMPCVINLSVGGDFGPHDGTSALEKGLAAMVGDDKPGRAIVVAAGNSGDVVDVDGGQYGIHTEVHVEPHEAVRVPIVASAATKGQAYVWATFRRGDDLAVSLEGPGGSTWVGFTGKGDQAGYDDGDGTTAGIVNNLTTKSSTIPAESNSAVVVWDGSWPEGGTFAVHLRGSGDAQLWITGTGDAAPAAGRLGVLFGRAVREGTVTVPASHPNLLAVGCTLNRVSWKPLGSVPIALALYGHENDPVADSACYFSSSGPTPLGVLKPEISAPGGVVAGAMSSLADPRTASPGGLFDGGGCPEDAPNCYLVDNTHAITSGTSMSSPHVAGAVALLFQLDPTLTQARVTDVLQAGARRPGGHVPFASQLGPGELDLEGARQALAAEQASSIAPSIAKSWYTLSSGYARADATFPVWGTVELRRADGTIASGLDGTKLTLSLRDAVLIQPLTKVRHGLWRFAFAGADDKVGKAARIEVLYDGASLGVRYLPIGTDAWTTDATVEAVGGCAIRARRGSSWGGAALVFAGALAVRRVRRRSARR